MIERQGDMFEEYLSPEVMYVITTNGYVKNNGQAVMGRGVAKVASTLNRALPSVLGDLLLTHGNRPFLLPGNFVTLPVKHHWQDKADMDLIDSMIPRLGKLLDLYVRGRKLYLPRPGCGNGQLSWYTVKPRIENTVKAWEALYALEVTVWSL